MPERRRHERRRQARLNKELYSRREFLGFSTRTVAVAAGVVTTLGVAGAWYWWSENSEDEVDRLIAEYKAKEGKLEPVILKFERGFERFTAAAEHKIATSKTSAVARTSLDIPFKVAEINRGNLNRNVYLWKRKDLETRRSLSSGSVAMGDPNYFFIDTSVANPNAVASFAPPSRTLHLDPAYDPNNTLDNLVAFHELIHAAQDAKDRAELPMDHYLGFFTDAERRRVIKTVPLYEATAYAEEIYLLDLFTDGQFREDVLKGQINLPHYRGLLGARLDQDSVIATLANMATQFYRGVSNLEGIDERFISYIGNIYRQNGAEVYERTPRGFFLSH